MRRPIPVIVTTFGVVKGMRCSIVNSEMKLNDLFI